MNLSLPTKLKNVKGEKRRIGLELEFAGIEPDKAAKIITLLYGGKIQKEHRYQLNIRDTELGDFRVELDARILQQMATQNIFDAFNFNIEQESLSKSIEDVVDKLARSVVPLEIVMPPVPIEELPKLEKLRKALQENKAEGTHTSLVHAFGMHINIESPDLEISTLLNYLRSFVIIYPWLLEILNIDFSRRISPFVDPFPEAYVTLILDPDYKPDQIKFIEDYINHNPTRNRPVDMMPILGMLNEELIEPVMEGAKNLLRPTFHYRLPNSRVDDPEWTFMSEWNYWIAVEKLAADKDLLEKLSRLYLLRKRKTVMSFRREWANTVQILLDLDE